MFHLNYQYYSLKYLVNTRRDIKSLQIILLWTLGNMCHSYTMNLNHNNGSKRTDRTLMNYLVYYLISEPFYQIYLLIVILNPFPYLVSIFERVIGILKCYSDNLWDWCPRNMWISNDNGYTVYAICVIKVQTITWALSTATQM